MQKLLTTSPPTYEQSQGLLPPGPGSGEQLSSGGDRKIGEISNAPVYVQAPGPTAPGLEQPPFNPGYPALNSQHPPHNPGYPAHNPGYPAQNAGYPAQYPMFTTPQITSRTFSNLRVAPATIAVGPLGPYPSGLTCPRCSKAVITEVKKNPNFLAWVACASLVLVGCFFGCCLFPFCMSGCQNVEHYCPECKVYLGSYSGTDYSRARYSHRASWRRY